MNSISKRMIAGIAIAFLASIFSSCSPVFVAQSRPRPVIYSAPAPAPEPVYASTLPPPPVQTVVVTPVVPVWAPPYVYVNEVHYYYFPDYMVYYDVFAQNYWYFDGYSWVHVITLPSIPVYYGFDPYSSYIVVMNRHTHDPWMRHTFFERQYPRGYYKSTYAPRQSLGSNTVLRAYDENQSRPLFIDKRSNKEVNVKYDVQSTSQQPAGKTNTRPNSNSTVTDGRPVNPKSKSNSVNMNNDVRPLNPKSDKSQGIKNNSMPRKNSSKDVNNNPKVQTEIARPSPKVNSSQSQTNKPVVPNVIYQKEQKPVSNTKQIHNKVSPMNDVESRPFPKAKNQQGPMPVTGKQHPGKRK